MILKDKQIMLTGGCGALGSVLLRALLTAGAKVGVLDIDGRGLAELKRISPEVFVCEADLTDPSQVTAAVEKFLLNRKRVDALINNAGMIYSAPLARLNGGKFEKHSIEDWDRVLRVNLSAPFYLTNAVVETMLNLRTKGVIVNICSISAEGNPGQSAYSAAKAGLTALTKTWAKELGPLGLRCAGVAPGFMDTDSTRKALSAATLEGIKKRVPQRRLGLPEEFAAAVLSVLENDYFNGKILELDGGLTI